MSQYEEMENFIQFHPLMTFPEKCFLVANDSYLIRWTEDYTAVIVEPDVFEAEVMAHYPGFVQNCSFVNLRRLFRQYGFTWYQTRTKSVVFTHPSFVRYEPARVEEVKTKRKSGIIGFDRRTRRGGKDYDIRTYFLQLARGEKVDEIPPIIDENIDSDYDVKTTPVKKRKYTKRNGYKKKSYYIKKNKEKRDDSNKFYFHGEEYEEIGPKDCLYENHSPEDIDYIKDLLTKNEFTVSNEPDGDDSLDRNQFTDNTDENLVILKPVKLSEIPEDCCLNAGCYCVETKVGDKGTVNTCVSVRPSQWPCPCIVAYLNGISNPQFAVQIDDPNPGADC